MVNMEIAFVTMGAWAPPRDVSWGWKASVVDDDGVRYPALLMVEGVAIAELRERVDEPYDEIIEAMYREELERLLRAGTLKPQNAARTINTVFFACGTDRDQVQEGDIVVWNTRDKLLSFARALGRKVGE